MSRYSFEHKDKLKKQIVEWTENIGVFKEMNVECDSFQAFIKLCQEGAILCNVISRVLNVKIVGVHRKSCTKTTALSNIRKFIDIFKRTN